MADAALCGESPCKHKCSAVKPVEARGQWARDGGGGGGGGFPQTPALLQMTEGGRCGVQDWDQL